jgi:Ca-activated chloride channel family protein
MARALAIGGWTALAIGGTQTHFADGVARGGGRRFSGTQTGATPTFIFLNPGAPLAQLAEETGGERIGSAASISGALEDLARRIRITYQVDREPDPDPRRVAILSLRAGLTVRAPAWTSSTTSDAVAEARALDLLGGRDPRGDLEVTAKLLPSSGSDPSVEATIDFAPLAATARQIGATKVRMTVAVAMKGAPAQVFHRIAAIEDLASQAGLIWTAPIKLDENAGAIAVVAEELTTGSWGGARVARGEETAEAKGTFPAITPASGLPIASAPPAMNREQAIARAAAERKLVIAFEWDARCGGCNQIEETAATNTEVAARLRGFVVLPSAASTWTGDPRLAAYDPAGDLFVSWPAIGEQRAGRRYLSAGDLTALLQRAAAAAPHVLRACDLLAAGDAIGAQLALALAYRESDELALAETAYEKAARLARDASDAPREQTSIALRALTIARLGRPADAVKELQAIVAAPATRLNEAEARLVLGMIHRASGDETKAAAEIEAVLRLAPHDSEAYRAALEISRGEPGAVGLADPNDPSGRRLQLIVGGRPPFSGKTRLQVIVRDPTISSVEFRVDQERAITDAAPPFEARVDLGNVPRRREIRATARGAKGTVVAEDAIVLNERHDEFWVRLRTEEGSRLVRAETNLPAGAKARSLAFFVDGKQFRPLTSQPAAIQLPSDEPVLVRVVATLDDGSTAEDAALMGATGYSETIEARDVEIYASVLDPSGSPMSALDRSQFAIEEDGRKKRIGGFEFLGRAPFAVGIAVDSSSSMRDEMPDVHRTARAFLDLATRDGSSAFVVDFDTTPRLAAARTRDRAILQNAVSLIRADGSTALYDAVIFGLLQLQGVPGKRALIVLTDGRDETSRYGLKDAVRVARESGVAIYAIILAERSGLPVPLPGMPGVGPGVSRGAIYPMRGSRAGVDPGLEKIAAESGGRAWYLPESANMEAIYRAIDLELRNQYRLTYRTAPGRGSSDWREVSVRVDQPGATVRTAAGFVAQ